MGDTAVHVLCINLYKQRLSKNKLLGSWYFIKKSLMLQHSAKYDDVQVPYFDNLKHCVLCDRMWRICSERTYQWRGRRGAGLPGEMDHFWGLLNWVTGLCWTRYGLLGFIINEAVACTKNTSESVCYNNLNNNFIKNYMLFFWKWREKNYYMYESPFELLR